MQNLTRRVPTGFWFIVAQGVSRLSSMAVFALVAQGSSVDLLGSFALAWAFTAVAASVAPPVIGKPIASITASEERRSASNDSYSFCVYLAAVASIPLSLVSWLLPTGVVSAAFLGGAVGLAPTMVVEAGFWKLLYQRGAPSAALATCAAYTSQAVCTGFILNLTPLNTYLRVTAPFIALGIPVLIVLTIYKLPSIRGAQMWWHERKLWVHYLSASGANLGVALLIPVLLSAFVGLGAAAVYRASEIALGAANVCIAAAAQWMLSRSSDPLPTLRRTYTLGMLGLGLVVLLNTLAISLAPEALVAQLLGSVSTGLLSFFPLLAIQRYLLGLASLGDSAAVGIMSAKKYSHVNLLIIGSKLALLAAGSAQFGLAGAVAALILAEFATALVFALLIWEVQWVTSKLAL